MTDELIISLTAPTADMVIKAAVGGSNETHAKTIFDLMQTHSSFVVTDQKGTLLSEVGEMLRQNGYWVAVFNTVDSGESMKYNPLACIHDRCDLLNTVELIMQHTNAKIKDSNKANKDKANNKDETKLFYAVERSLLTALIGWMMDCLSAEERNIETLLQLINTCLKSDVPLSPLDTIFKELEADESKGGSKNSAVCKYKEFKLAAGRATELVLFSCCLRLSTFNCELVGNDELELERIGNEKTAFFIVISDTNHTYDFLAAMVLKQMFYLLQKQVAADCGGMPLSTHVLINEIIATIGDNLEFKYFFTIDRNAGHAAPDPQRTDPA